MIYTGYLNKISKYRSDGLMVVFICQFIPRHEGILDKDIPLNHQWIKSLAPDKKLLYDIKNKLISKEQYKSQYLSILDKLGVDRIVNCLVKLSGYYNKDLILCCYEKNPNECHRSILAEYLRENLIIEEYKL